MNKVDEMLQLLLLLLADIDGDGDGRRITVLGSGSCHGGDQDGHILH